LIFIVWTLHVVDFLQSWIKLISWEGYLIHTSCREVNQAIVAWSFRQIVTSDLVIPGLHFQYWHFINQFMQIALITDSGSSPGLGCFSLHWRTVDSYSLHIACSGLSSVMNDAHKRRSLVDTQRWHLHIHWHPLTSTDIHWHPLTSTDIQW